jgi:serine acetyltransferase
MPALKETFQIIRQDFNRRVQLEGAVRQGFFNKLAILFKPGFVGVLCYRLSSYLIETRLRVLCRVLHSISFFYARVEIAPEAIIGPGLVVSDVAGVGLPEQIVIGKNCTFLGFNTLTLNKVGGVDFMVDKIVIGDHCVVGFGAKIMRAIEIADGAQIKENSVVMFSVKKVGSTMVGIPAKRKRIDEYENIVNWNPLKGGPVGEVS